MWLEVHLSKVSKRRWRAGISYALYTMQYAHARFWWLALWRAWRASRGSA